MSASTSLKQIVILLLGTVLIITTGTVVLLYPDQDNDKNPYVDESYPWCFKPDSVFIQTEADVDLCVIRAMIGEDGRPKPWIENFRRVYQNNLEELSPEEREEAIRVRRVNYLRWIGRHDD